MNVNGWLVRAIYWGLAGTTGKKIGTTALGRKNSVCTFPGPQNAASSRLFFTQSCHLKINEEE